MSEWSPDPVDVQLPAADVHHHAPHTYARMCALLCTHNIITSRMHAQVLATYGQANASHALHYGIVLGYRFVRFSFIFIIIIICICLLIFPLLIYIFCLLLAVTIWLWLQYWRNDLINGQSIRT